MFFKASATSETPNIPDGFPSIKNFTLSFPLNDTLPSASTCTDGTFAKASDKV